jgi:hypothetical protein
MLQAQKQTPLASPAGNARGVVVTRLFFSVARRGGQQQATGRGTDRRRLFDFGGWRSFFTARDRRSHLRRNGRNRGCGLGRLESMLASTKDLRSRIRSSLARRSSAPLARRRNLAGRVNRSGTWRRLRLDQAEAVLLLQHPLVAGVVLDLRQAAMNLRQVEAEVMLGGARRLAASRNALTTGIWSALGRCQSTGRAIRI